MVVWIATILSQLWFGTELAYFYLDKRLNLMLKVSCGIYSGIGISSVVFYFCSCLVGQNIIHLLIHTSLLASAAFVLFKKRYKPISLKLLHYSNYIKYVPILFYFIGSFYLVFKFYLPTKRSFSIDIDQYIHEELSFIASFYTGVNSGLSNPFHIHHPNYAGKYSFSKWLSASHSSMLMIGFAGLRTAIVVPSALLLTSFCTISYFFAMQFRLPYYIAMFAPILSLNISGFGFFRFLDNGKRNARTNDYVSESGYAKFTRFHPLIHLTLGFRHSTYALPIVLYTISYLYYSFIHKSHNLKFVGFVAGFVLPAVQHHSFIGLTLFLIIFYFITRAKFKMMNFIIFYALGFLFHVPRLIYIPKFNIFEKQWSNLIVHGELLPSFNIWYNTFGFFMFVVFFLSLFVLGRNEYSIFIPSVSCFFIFNFIKLQEIPELNALVFLSVFYTTGSVVFLSTLYRFSTKPIDIEQRGVISAISLILFISCTLSSVMGIHRQKNNVKGTWGVSDENIANWLIKNSPKDAVFLYPLLNFNPVSALAGRTVYIEQADLMKLIGYDFIYREEEFLNFHQTQKSDDILQIVDFIIDVNNDWNLSKSEWKEIYYSRDCSIYQNKNKL